MAVQPVERVCLNCMAQPGQPCTRPTDTTRRPVGWFHLERTYPA